MDNKRINGIENDTQVVGKIMKALVYRLCAVLACVAALFASCRGYKQIPEETLADIFKDMYVLNAYMERNNMNLRFDSVDIYGPLIGKYGYTAEDFRQTITDATKRKSFRLTDIVEAAIAKLEAEQAAVTERVRVLDLIDSMAYAVSRREVFRDSLITIRSLADSAALTLRVPLEEGAGKVDITYSYRFARRKQESDQPPCLVDGRQPCPVEFYAAHAEREAHKTQCRALRRGGRNGARREVRQLSRETEANAPYDRFAGGRLPAAARRGPQGAVA